MSDFFEVLKARKDYLSRKYKKTYVHHPETGFKGTTGQFANRLMNQRFAELGINPKDLTKEQKEDYRKKIENDILNIPDMTDHTFNDFGLKQIDKPPKEEAPLKYVSHADGFKGTIGQRAFRMIQDGIKGGMDIPEHQKEALRQNLVLDMQQNPEKYGLTEIVGAKRTDFSKKKTPKSTKTPQAASAPPKIAPILPKETTTQESTPDGLNMGKVMQAMKLLQTNGLPVNAESIKALLPHLPEETPQTKSRFQSFYPELTEDGRFNTTPRSSFRGSDIVTPAQKEEMLQYFRDNPDERVQDTRFFQDAFDEGIEGGLDADQFLAQLMNRGGLHNRGKGDKSTWKDKANRNEGKDIRGNLLDTSRAADPDKAFSELFPARYKEEGGLASADTTSATDDMDRPEIPDSLDPKKNKKRIENIERQQKIFDAKSGMTEEQLMLARQKKMEADRVRARQQDATRETVMAGETKPAEQMTMDDWVNRLQISAANPTGAPPTTLNSNFDNSMFDENGNLKEEYR